MNNKGPLQQKSYAFALRCVRAYRYLSGECHEHVLSKQMVRSGTSIGANCKEAINAQSRADFINKLSIALKEAGETEYWLELLHDGEYIDNQTYESIINDCIELIKLLTSIINSTKTNN